MKALLTLLCLMIFLAGPSLAETRYISDVLVVTVRDQPRDGGELLTTLKTGEPLEILEELKGFVKVRTEKGVEGYVNSQYVSAESPKAEQIMQLQAENTLLRQKVDQLSASLAGIKTKAASLSSSAEELAQVKEEYQALQKDAANVLQITSERDQLQQENSDLTLQMQKLKEENNLYLRIGVIKWFIAGAGVLAFGWILGKFSRKKKRGY